MSNESSPSTQATTTPAQPESAASASQPKVGVLFPWIAMVVVLLALWIVHSFVLDPLSEAIQQVDALKNLTTSMLPGPIQEAAGELISWYVSLSIQTPAGPLASLLALGMFIELVGVRFLATLMGALFGHILLLVTGGTAGGWRVTFRIFALNRAWVELLTLVFILFVAYVPMAIAIKLLLLLVGLLMIRLLGMATLLAQIVREQDLGSFRTFVIAAPLFGIFTVFSMFLSMVSFVWVGLWCIAKIG